MELSSYIYATMLPIGALKSSPGPILSIYIYAATESARAGIYKNIYILLVKEKQLHCLFRYDLST
jgi:hypothetical protein